MWIGPHDSYSDELTFILPQKLRIPTKFCNRKPSKLRNFVKICKQLVTKVFKNVSQTGPRLVRSNSCKGPNLRCKRAKGPNENCGASKCHLGPNFCTLAPKRLTWPPWPDSTLTISDFLTETISVLFGNTNPFLILLDFLRNVTSKSPSSSGTLKHQFYKLFGLTLTGINFYNQYQRTSIICSKDMINTPPIFESDKKESFAVSLSECIEFITSVSSLDMDSWRWQFSASLVCLLLWVKICA